MNQRSTFALGLKSGKSTQGTNWQLAAPRYDVATAIQIGGRAYQQDALMANFPTGSDTGIGILADGLGGHLGGDTASAIVLGTAFSEIKSRLIGERRAGLPIGPLLRRAIDRANDAVAAEVDATPALRGMGSTCIACVMIGPDLYWASVGDSPLYLYRDGALTRLNEDHSMGPRIDAMLASGLITADLAKDHPQRNQLTSAICGDEIPSVDCPVDAYPVKAGDILILASDGLQTLSDDAICGIIHRKRRRDAEDIAQTLMQGVFDAADPEQDNISVMAVKVVSDAKVRQTVDEPVAAPVEPEGQGAPTSTPDAQMEKASDLLNEALRL